MDNRPRENTEFGHDLDSDQELEQLEQKLGLILKEYDVEEYPSDDEIMKTIDAIKPYVPVKENKWKLIYENISSIMRQSLREVFYLGPLFWSLNTILLLIGFVVVLLMERNPYGTILLLGPIPTITGLLEVLKSHNAGMEELEMSFKHNLQEVILSKMVAVGGLNLCLNLVFTIVVSAFQQDVWMWKLMLYWVTPFTVITAISFMVVNRFRNTYTVAVGLGVWIILGALLSQTRLIEKIEMVPGQLYILVILTALLFILNQMIQIMRKGVSCELNHR